LKEITESALQSNRETIEAIFSQIHSPAEFKEIGRDWTLIKKGGDEKVPLTKISTGQRAAFALSVFLAQNAQLRAGPRVILIDDPIAHVDDLNCLSFLDYLREIVIAGNRQVFFATASDKLASLFERKFDFLGARYKRLNLTRNPLDAA
jgi:ABC-type lipoprotein export system ATPase subunit